MSNYPERIWVHTNKYANNWYRSDRGVGDTEYIRADVANAEIEKWQRHSAMVERRAHEELDAKDAEIERLKQVADQMVIVGGFELEGNALWVGDYKCEPHSWPLVTSYLKEKEKQGCG